MKIGLLFLPSLIKQEKNWSFRIVSVYWLNMKYRNLKYTELVLKGMAMGAADVIPGVSGGTIAFITGIYEELVNSIKSINLKALKLLFSGRLSAFWRYINGTFLLSVLSGIGISIFSFAKGLKYLLDNYPLLIPEI